MRNYIYDTIMYPKPKIQKEIELAKTRECLVTGVASFLVISLVGRITMESPLINYIHCQTHTRRGGAHSCDL